jgi:ATP/maltotriose-dependent transcriptional regulator MalT/DNA-binding SARP family transcriptional activator
LRVQGRHGRGARTSAFTLPALPPATLRRARLEELLDEVFGKRLATVVAGPGYGKSTLLASWCSDVAAAWCSVSERATGLAHIARGLETSLEPWLSGDVPAVVAGGQSSARADAYAGALAEALEAGLDHDLVLVLDDVHEVERGSTAARLIESFCKQVPILVHVIVSSRARVPFPIERIRGWGGVLELDSTELGFTVDEVASLAEAMSVPLGAEAARSLQQATGGWPAAIRLVLEALHLLEPGAELEPVLDRLVRPEGALYSYLAEEVFASDGPAMRDLLRRSAPFERVSPGLSEALGCAEPALLTELARRGLALEVEEGWFAVHGLVREFVGRAWPLSPPELAEMHRRAAAWLDAQGLHEEALRSLAGAGEHAELARVLSRRGGELVARGHADVVVRYGELVEPDALDSGAEEALGEAYTVLGDSERALRHLARAAGPGRLRPSVAWRIAAAYHLEDDLEAASAVRERTELRGAPAFDRALLLAWSASAERRLGRFEEAAQLAEQSLAAAERSGDERARALAYTASALTSEGTRRDPLSDLERALAAAERAGDVFQQTRIHNNRGSILLESGDYVRAIAELNAALRLAEIGGFPTLAALATMNRGLCHFCLGRLDESAADYEAATRMYRRTGSRELAYALIGLGDVHRERGDVEQARVAYEEGLALGERTGDRQALVPALYQLAKVMVDDEPDRALELAERAVDLGWPDRAWALNARGWVQLALGDAAAAATDAEHAAAAAREHRDPFGLAESLELAAVSSADAGARTRSLEEALSIWRRCGNAVHEAEVEVTLARLSTGADATRLGGRAERRLRALGVRESGSGPAGLLRFVGGGEVPPLAIETLGSFRVLRSGVPVSRTEWQSQKARDLLKILVARRGAPTPRDLLMEALWGGGDPAKLPNRLSVALNTVHAVLDPGKEHETNHYVWADKRAVGLELARVLVDVEVFLAEASEGLELRARGHGGSQERLEHAFALYRGDFLEGDTYEEWAASLREEARAAYLDVAHVLADDASADGRHDDAVRFSLRILDRDPHDERAHLRLVASLGAGSRHGEARRRYRLYCQRMEEIGVEWAPFPSSGAP